MSEDKGMFEVRDGDFESRLKEGHLESNRGRRRRGGSKKKREGGVKEGEKKGEEGKMFS